MKQITKYVIKNNLKRLFQYRICLLKFKKMGFDRVYSYNLGEEAGVSAAQVRKDFSDFKIKGNKKGGYHINDLLTGIEEIFRHETNQHVILIGMGNIGRALSHYKRFNHRKMIIVGAFDIDPSKQSKKFGVPVYPIDNIPNIIDRFHVRVAILAVPEISAQEMCDLLIGYGIRGFVNFAPVVLKVPKGVIVNDINLCDELESVIYYTRNHDYSINE